MCISVLLQLVRLLFLLLLLLMLLLACAPSRHRVCLASVTNLPGKVEGVDRKSASVIVKISIRACRVPGQSSKCFSVCGAWPDLGQLGSTVLPIKCSYNNNNNNKQICIAP